MLTRKLIYSLLLSIIGLPGLSSIRLPVIFQSDMVLQRDKSLTIWGWAAANEPVTIILKGHKYHAKAGKDARWSINLPPQQAGGPFDINVVGSKDTINLKNILFGDVWICGGQSNMQFTLQQIGYTEKDSAKLQNKNIRLFTSPIEMDYVARQDLAGGKWKVVSLENINQFSATAYFFGSNLQSAIDVPIGLISVNLGATAIETWMSPQALQPLPQFQAYYNEYLAPGRSFKEITETFEKQKKAWQEKYYWTGQGIDEKWYKPDINTDGWRTMEVPGWWEENGLPDIDGAVWFRKSFDLPAGFKDDFFFLPLNQIDDYDVAWINGHKIGESYGNFNWRNYKVPVSLLKEKNNTLVVRIVDIGGRGGMYTGAIWGNPVLLGKWHYKKDSTFRLQGFKKPHTVNASPFSTPAVLFNANIAPLKKLAIKGFIWYQGESNVSRAVEYKTLFPALINDWRKQFNQDNLPFLFVQLANYMAEPIQPQESQWAELREAQAAALSLPQTGMAVAIDIGEADDIHPKNKRDVGKRLALAALKTAYLKEVESQGPTYSSFEINDDSIIVHFDHAEKLYTKDKYGYIKGFAIAGADKVFHWAKAFIKENTVVVFAEGVKKPVAVRYAWADNPGSLDLYNRADLPATPFRTDNWMQQTHGRTFSLNPWEL